VLLGISRGTESDVAMSVKIWFMVVVGCDAEMQLPSPVDEV
jgi:hypothetical protein